MPSSYERVLAKYDWANKHIDDFETAVDRFGQKNLHTIGRKHDDQTGEFVYYVVSVPTIPDSLAFMLGDVLHNLRSTLDHLVCALVTVADPSNTCTHTSFPIFDTPETYGSLLRSKVPGLRQPCYEIFDRIQPYKTGRGIYLWQLHQLDIMDKHRMLLTLASANVGHTMTPSEIASLDAIKAVVAPRARVGGNIRMSGSLAGTWLCKQATKSGDIPHLKSTRTCATPSM